MFGQFLHNVIVILISVLFFVYFVLTLFEIWYLIYDFSPQKTMFIN